jgi:C1A family cysteine protease
MPGPGDTVVGGHAVLVVGYAFDNKIPGQPTAVWIVENSWGAGWGERGFFSMPASYLTNPNLAGDFWKISLVS